MAVYTKLSESDIKNFLKNYSIGDLVSYKEIIDGIDNSNYIIETTSNKFIFTIFEKRINKNDLPFFMNLKLHLAKKGICCPKPIANNSGNLISEINDKAASIVTFLSGATLKSRADGYYDSINPKHCLEVGDILSKLHNAVADFSGSRHNDLGIDGWRNLFNKIANQIEDYQKDLASEIITYLDFIESNWNHNLSRGAVHVDLFPDNVFFDQNGNLSGVIDFYFSATDSFIYDLAVTINPWCFDEKNNFIQEKYDALIKGYTQNRQINKEENDFLKIALVGASMRFLLTRLYDLFHTPKGSLVNVKNPQEYLAKIRYFYSQIKTS